MPFTAPGPAPKAIEAPTSCLAEIHEPAYPDIPYCGDMDRFYNHPVIRELAGREAWTVSGNTTKSTKVPLDAKRYDMMMGQVRGAVTYDRNCLATLDEVRRIFQPEIQGREHVPYAHYLDCLRDGYVCLDAEPTCDPELRKKFLRMPFLYGEFSMSGKGIHLIFKLPKEILAKYPEAQKKIKMQHGTGTYEILMCHYMTFTGNMIEPPQDALEIAAFHEVFEDLCKAQTNQDKIKDFDMELMPEDEIPGYVSVMWKMRLLEIKKKREEYASESHYEYGVASKIMFEVFDILHQNPIELNNHKYTNQEITMLVYYKLVQMLKHRPKHDELRDGMPFLLYLCKNIISKNPGPYSKDYVSKDEYKRRKMEERRAEREASRNPYGARPDDTDDGSDALTDDAEDI